MITKKNKLFIVSGIILATSTIIWSSSLLNEIRVQEALEILESFGKQDLFNDQAQKVYTSCDTKEAKRSNLENELKNLKAKNPDNSLRAIDAKEKASVKGCEIAKIGSLARTARANYDIEIVSTNPIEGGVEVFARAWDKQGNQIGFGKDGSVDIERFRIINPPVLVDDPNGLVVRTWTEDGELKTRRLREDHQEALLQSLEHTIKVVSANTPRNKIIHGKIGNTTSTFYPAAGAAEPMDAWYRKGGTSWATIRSGNSDEADVAAGTFGAGAAEFSGDPSAGRLERSIALFDTSSIADTDTVDSATFSLYVTLNQDGSSKDPNYVITQSNPGSTSAAATTDWTLVSNTVDTPTEGSARIGDASITTSQYNDWALNATGLTWVSKTGLTKLGMREGKYDIDNVDPNLTLNTGARIRGSDADTTGTAEDPKLVVVHSAGAATEDVTNSQLILIGI
jgi:hypothetical protein